MLGCAGMVDLAAEMAATHGVPVIEGAGAAVKLAEALIGLKLFTSKTGGWATPTAKPYDGALIAFDGIGATP